RQVGTGHWAINSKYFILFAGRLWTSVPTPKGEIKPVLCAAVVAAATVKRKILTNMAACCTI
ncbi:MAG: hypothetical protein ACI4DY_01890, partial [Monoglobaceae bacterium]